KRTPASPSESSIRTRMALRDLRSCLKRRIHAAIDRHGLHASGISDLFRLKRREYQTGVAVTLNNLANAKKLFEESFEVTREIADQKWSPSDLAWARRMFEDALRIHLERSDKSRAATILGNGAIRLQDQSFLTEAKNKFEESLAMLREIDDKRG